MRLSETGIGLIQRYEGFRPNVYLDAAGLPTIGYGHLLAKNEVVRYAQGIDIAAAHALLRQDVMVAEKAVGRWIYVPLRQEQFDALVSFTFNLGSATLQRSTLRQVINRGEYAYAPPQFMRYIWAGGRPLKGLVLRRKAEVELFTANS
jgi:lysozyme